MSRLHPLEQKVNTTLTDAEKLLQRVRDLGAGHTALLNCATDHYKHALKMTQEFGNAHHDSRANVLENCRRIRRANDGLRTTVEKIEDHKSALNRIFPCLRKKAA